jgi:hypothetical protein
MSPRQLEQMEKGDAIKQRYADLARQFSEQAKQIANDADRAERLVPAQCIPPRRWQADYDSALLLNDQSVEIARLGDAAFQRCSETTLAPQRQRQATRALDPTPTSQNEIRRFPSKRLEETFAR